MLIISGIHIYNPYYLGIYTILIIKYIFNPYYTYNPYYLGIYFILII